MEVDRPWWYIDLCFAAFTPGLRLGASVPTRRMRLSQARILMGATLR
jgi:hypothetical protein